MVPARLTASSAWRGSGLARTDAVGIPEFDDGLAPGKDMFEELFGVVVRREGQRLGQLL